MPAVGGGAGTVQLFSVHQIKLLSDGVRSGIRDTCFFNPERLPANLPVAFSAPEMLIDDPLDDIAVDWNGVCRWSEAPTARIHE